MLAINIALLVIFGAVFLLSIKNKDEGFKDIDKKEHKLYFLYPMSDWFLTKTGLEKKLKRNDLVNASIRALYLTNKPELLQKLFWCSRISTIIVILILFNLLSFLGQLKSTNSFIIINEKYLMRPSYGEGSSEVELEVIMKQAAEENSSEKDQVSQSQKVRIDISEHSYSQSELEETLKEAKRFLRTDVLGSNESSEKVYENLHFCDTIPGTSIKVKWIPGEHDLIQTDGTVSNEEISAGGVATSVTAILSYKEQQTDYTMHFKIMPKKYSEEEVLHKKLVEHITEFSEKSAEKSQLELPDTLENYRLSYSSKDKNTGMTLLIFGAITAIVIWLFGDKELIKKMEVRKEQMRLDYPELINKFTLLVNAGMTVKQAWNKIAEDYSIKYSNKELKKHYAYEEMLTTANELKLGLPESVAYEQYGRRIGLIPYIKFSSLIAQNLKKGNKGFTNLLMQEAIEAFEDRKEIAKRLGEEAGTKLLIPMMLMLIIVFLIILIPAFWSFGI